MSAVNLCLGHVGDTGGAPPARHAGLREDLLVSEYGGWVHRLLLAGGLDVAVHGSRPYAARRAHARDSGGEAYLALHVNAAPAGHPQDYGLVLHGEADGSRALAESIARELARLPELRRVLCEEAGPPRWPVATATLTSAPLPSVLIEPGFVTASAHRSLWTPDGLRRIGTAVAAGVLRWRA